MLNRDNSTKPYLLATTDELKKMIENKIDVEAANELIKRSYLGSHHLFEVDDDEAREIAKKYHALYPEHALFNYIVGTSALRQIKYSNNLKLDDIKKSQTTNPFFFKAFQNGDQFIKMCSASALTDAFYRQKNGLEALAWFTQALLLDSKSANNIFKQGNSSRYIIEHSNPDVDRNLVSRCVFFVMRLFNVTIKDIQYSKWFAAQDKDKEKLFNLNYSHIYLPDLGNPNSEISLFLKDILANDSNFLPMYIHCLHRNNCIPDQMFFIVMKTISEVANNLASKDSANYNLFKYFFQKESFDEAQYYFEKISQSFNHYRMEDFKYLPQEQRDQLFYLIFKKLLAGNHLNEAYYFLTSIQEYRLLDRDFFTFLHLFDPNSKNYEFYRYKEDVLNKVTRTKELDPYLKIEAEAMLHYLQKPNIVVIYTLQRLIANFEEYIEERNRRVAENPLKFWFDEFFNKIGEKRKQFVANLASRFEHLDLSTHEKCKQALQTFLKLINEAEKQFLGKHIEKVIAEAKEILLGAQVLIQNPPQQLQTQLPLYSQPVPPLQQISASAPMITPPHCVNETQKLKPQSLYPDLHLITANVAEFLNIPSTYTTKAIAPSNPQLASTVLEKENTSQQPKTDNLIDLDSDITVLKDEPLRSTALAYPSILQSPEAAAIISESQAVPEVAKTEKVLEKSDTVANLEPTLTEKNSAVEPIAAPISTTTLTETAPTINEQSSPKKEILTVQKEDPSYQSASTLLMFKPKNTQKHEKAPKNKEVMEESSKKTIKKRVAVPC